MKKIKKWILYNIVGRLTYKYWIRLRKKSMDEHGDKLCYCGHTFKCDCGDPDELLFRESLMRGNIKLTDKNNGWKNI
jgi:hypothetical protein